ncbi:MAG: hypothetical protein J6D08_17535 [Lachnospiraceae bacterium]|nr:hypothetical protein [Lachnospiraceae bacterium]
MNGNYRQALRDCEVELNSIQQWIDSNRLDSNVRFLTSYSVIKACGTVEYVFKQIVYDYLSSGANEEAKTYLNKSIIEASFNPSTGQMYRILEKINSNWRVGFENLIKGSLQMGQLNSLVKLRNSFAHGSVITASINDVKSYYNAGIWILEKLCEVMV